MESLLARIEAIETRIARLEESAREKHDPVAVVKADLARRQVFTSRFFTTPANYYDLTLEQRAQLLSGNESQLCKSIIFENLACDHQSCEDPTNPRYVLVIVQYIGE